MLGQIQNSGVGRGRSDFFTRAVQVFVDPPASVFRTSIGHTSEFLRGVRDARQLRRENERLRGELAAMGLYQETVERLRDHVDSLRAMNDYVPPPSRTKVYANIIGYFPDQNSITIDRGSNDGIKKYMPVIAAKGLVGIVEVADPGRSRVLLVTSRSIRVAAQIVGEPRVPGILHGETSTRLAFDPIDTGDVLTGAQVLTWHSETIPEGIPIGIVVEALDDPQFGTKRVFVLPHVQVGELNEVFVLR